MAGYIYFDERGIFEGFDVEKREILGGLCQPVGPLGELIGKKKKAELVQAVERGGISEEPVSPLYVALLMDDEETMTFMLRHGFSLDETTFMHMVHEDMWIRIIDTLNSCRQIDSNRASQLLVNYMKDKKTQNFDVLQKLFAMGANPNTLYTYDFREGLKRPLIFEVFNAGSPKVLDLFLTKGANPNSVNEHQVSLLRFASEKMTNFWSDEQKMQHRKKCDVLKTHGAVMIPAGSWMEKIRNFF